MHLYPTQVCSKCQGTFDRDAFFRVRVLDAFSTSQQRHPKCIGCELSQRTADKEASRILVKATTTRGRHASRLSLKHTGQTLTGDEFGETFGWQLERMTADIEKLEHDGICSYCERPFNSMPGELAAITLDIVDPARKPYYKTNTRWCCATCNSEKSHTPPELWERKLLAWRQWNAWQAASATSRGMLF
jgi:hypothetical protein